MIMMMSIALLLMVGKMMIMVMASGEWKADIFKKIHDIYKDDEKTFAKVLSYLNEEQINYKGIPSPTWVVLKYSTNSGIVFKTCVELLVKKIQNNEDLLETLKKQRDNVCKKLAVLFKDDAETQVRILFYLDEEQKDLKDMSSSWVILTNLINFGTDFEKYVQYLV